ncbi:putative ribonuclease H-like domain-containing protein, partial [Tanacetum coccineum]
SCNKVRLVPVNANKQSSPRAAASISTVRHVNIVASKLRVNAASPIKYSYFKAYSPLRRPFNQNLAVKTNNFNEKVYTTKLNNVTTAGPEVVVSTTEGKRENDVESLACWIWRPTGKGNPQYALQDQGIFDSGCSRHMTGNKSYLTDYQDIDGGFVAFARSPKGGGNQTQDNCPVVTDDYSRFSWVFFLATKDETSGILKTFITSIENQINHKVKIIRCDNGTEFKNNDRNQFCRIKGIKREFSVARTPQQNQVAERKNRILIEATRTMLADSLLPTTFWAKAVNIACYVQNRVLADEGFLVGYSINSKAFSTRTRKVEENLYINFLENKPNVVGNGPAWLFDIDSLTKSMNYE